MKNTILVTGGAGFIGSHLTERLLEDGFRVTVIDSLSDYYNPKVKKCNLVEAKKIFRFKFYNTDICELRKLDEVFNNEKPEKVIHLASEVGVRPSFERINDYLNTNLVGTSNVLELVKKYKVSQLVFGSSSSVYGKRSGKQGFNETDSLSPISPYAATKQAAEWMIRVQSSKYNFFATALRFFTAYGPRNRPDMACFKFVDRISKGKQINLFGKGTRRDFTFIDDVVKGIVRAVKKPFKYEVINLGNSSPVRVSQLIAFVEKALGKKANIKHMPLPAGDVSVTFANVTKAKKLLGWQPKIPIEDGVGHLVDWYNAAYG